VDLRVYFHSPIRLHGVVLHNIVVPWSSDSGELFVTDATEYMTLTLLPEDGNILFPKPSVFYTIRR
jgi:hypothetical protein